MWVSPSARSKGVGKALMNAALAWAGEAGVNDMVLYVTRGNDAAKRLYSRIGVCRNRRASASTIQSGYSNGSNGEAHTAMSRLTKRSRQSASEGYSKSQ